MAYEKTIWKNREVERPRTFEKIENPDGTITLVPAEGNIIEQGTPIIAENMNKIEQGIEDAHNAIDEHKAEIVSQSPHGMGKIASQDYEEGLWTPTIEGTEINPTLNYVDRVGRYRKIGKYVHIECTLRVNVSEVGAGNLKIVGLPFVAPPVVLNGVTLGLKALLSSVNYDINLSGANINFATPTSTLKTGANYYLTFSAAYSLL